MPVPDKQAQISHTQKLLQQLKDDFLTQLPDRYEEIENLILQLDKDNDAVSTYDELYRNVHSLKGSAGTYGIHIITTICHHLEDLLNTIQDNFESINKQFINHCLRYIDLIKQVGDNTDDLNHISTLIENELESIRAQALKKKLRGLVAAGSSLVTLIVQDTLKASPVQLTMIDDGQTALSRLLHEKFDFLILGYEIHILNGEAITYALRASNSVNKDIPIIITSTKDSKNFKNNLKPNYMIKKNNLLSQNIANAIEDIIHAKNKKR